VESRIAILDYGMGNLRNVEKAFHAVGASARVTRSRKAIDGASAIVLPGVGAFRDCMENLDRFGLIEPLLRSIEAGKPYLGICLGLQILFSESEEFGSHRGLGLIPGKVVRFNLDQRYKVPHMGWNTVEIVKEVPLLEGIRTGDFFYFVHSYYVVPEEEGAIATVTDYGSPLFRAFRRRISLRPSFTPKRAKKKGCKSFETL
jgi:glutamine amidotransferase